MLPRLRTAFVGILLIGCLVALSLPALLIASLTGSASVIYRVAVPLARLAMWAAGIRIRVRGRERLRRRQNYLFMPNHRSNIDPPVVMAALRRDCRMMAKASLFQIPFFGALLRTAGFIPVIREDRDAAIAAVEDAADRLRRGLDFVVFPEGTRSRDGNLLPLKKGPFFMALAGGVPVTPVRISGGLDVMPRGGKVIYPGDVTVEVGEPIELDGLPDDADAARDELRHRVRLALG